MKPLTDGQQDNKKFSMVHAIKRNGTLSFFNSQIEGLSKVVLYPIIKNEFLYHVKKTDIVA